MLMRVALLAIVAVLVSARGVAAQESAKRPYEINAILALTGNGAFIAHGQAEALRAVDARPIVSVDTFKADVYRRAHAAGGDLLNSIWGASDALIDVCVETVSPIVVMHNKAVAIYEGDVIDEVLATLAAAAERCVRAGIPAEHVILDPGIGFGKTPEHNLSVLGALPRLVALGFPTLLGTSRKSTIGRLTARDVDGRAFGTAATVALAAAAGIDIVRVHDVIDQRDVVRVTDAIVRGWRPDGWSDNLH